ncbi:MAG: DeoR/GlpR family DNA-binding transcription regulator [Actinobacteria bacterium]|nr:DeoR/GlpR family DNA-binding transcription regulator [Actinomycetota bacterium]
MLAEHRRKEILEILYNKNDTTAEELAKIYKKSVPTIYKDIKILEKQNQLKKIYGGVKIKIDEKGFYDFFKRVDENAKIKRALAKEAIKLIANNDIIAIDSSTTAHYIVEELKNEDEKNITIVTNSAALLCDYEFISKDNINIYIIGGFLEKKIASFLETDPKIFLPNVLINKFFFSTFGFSQEYGVMDSFMPNNCAIKKILSEKSQESICLISSDKFKISGVINWVNFDVIKKIITDEFIEEEIVRTLKEKGVEVIKVKV